jgi:hypothetical protein
VVRPIQQIHGFQQLRDALAPLNCSLTQQQKRNFDVLICRQGRDQGKKLEKKADRPTPHLGTLVAVELADIFASDVYLPAGWLIQAAD